MRTLCNLGITVLAISSLFWVQASCRAETIASHIVVIRQIHPDGELKAIVCAEGERSCSLEIKVISEEYPRVKIDILITPGTAYFKFASGTERLEGNNLRHFYIPLGGGRTMQRKVTLYRPPQIEDEKAKSLHQSPVLRYSYNSIAELEITIVPKRRK